jgi:hypothetical protein
MTDSTDTTPSVNTDCRPVDNTAFAWGVNEIGRVIDRTGRQTNHLLATGQIKSAKKVGGRWVANRAALLREMGAGHV